MTKDVYEKLWKSDEYSKRNRTDLPYLVAKAIIDDYVHLNDVPPDTVTVADWGCGNGKAFDIFDAYEVTFMCDITDAGIDSRDAKNVTKVGRILDVSPEMQVTFSMCCDVLEHLPENEVLESVLRILDYTKVGAFFCVSNSSDIVDGTELHITRKAIPWWDRFFLSGLGPWVVSMMFKQQSSEGSTLYYQLVNVAPEIKNMRFGHLKYTIEGEWD